MTATSAFHRSFEALIGHEGGYSTDPADRGNWTSGKIGVGELKGTKYGIAAHEFPDLDIKGLTLAQAKQIYFDRYWKAVRGDELPEPIAFEAFDMAVNHGPTKAIELMQSALGVRSDGVIGPVTLAAAKKAEPARFIAHVNAERIFYYTDIKSWPTHGKGWARRVAANLRRA